MRQVGQHEQEVPQLLLHARELRLEGPERVARPRDLGQERARVFALSLGDADLLRQRVAAALQVLRAHLDVLALALERLERRGIEREPALGERGGDAGEVGAKEQEVEHCASLSEG